MTWTNVDEDGVEVVVEVDVGERVFAQKLVPAHELGDCFFESAIDNKTSKMTKISVRGEGRGRGVRGA